MTAFGRPFAVSSWPVAARHHPPPTGCFPARSGPPAEETNVPSSMTAYGCSPRGKVGFGEQSPASASGRLPPLGISLQPSPWRATTEVGHGVRHFVQVMAAIWSVMRRRTARV